MGRVEDFNLVLPKGLNQRCFSDKAQIFLICPCFPFNRCPQHSKRKNRELASQTTPSYGWVT
uniref:Uncharacterized protein n=2 Tax=Meloidogyne TaxID=189290 RepID=A0A6V7V578_MELEN|nr:unnamed protein product [Meloidogyne enterolobii]